MWMTIELRRLLDARRAATCAWRRKPSVGNERTMNAMHKQTATQLRDAQQANKRKQAKETNAAWQDGYGTHTAYRSLKGLHAAGKPRASIHALTDAQGQLHTDCASKAKAMQAHYKAIATPPAPQLHTDPDTAEHHATIEREFQNLASNMPDDPAKPHNAAFTTAEVKKAIKKLKRYKAAGHDNCPAELIKMGGPAILRMATEELIVVFSSSDLIRDILNAQSLKSATDFPVWRTAPAWQFHDWLRRELPLWVKIRCAQARYSQSPHMNRRSFAGAMQLWQPGRYTSLETWPLSRVHGSRMTQYSTHTGSAIYIATYEFLVVLLYSD